MTPKPFRTRIERFKFWLLAVVSMAQEAVVVFSFTKVRPDWRAKMLFSDWIDRIDSVL